jgi:galactoside O-acetyltransferase
LLDPLFIVELAASIYWKSRLGRCGARFRVKPTTTVTGHAHIAIGENFSAQGQLQLHAENGWIEIGDDVSVNSNVMIAASDGRITIGNGVLIASNVVLRSSDHATARCAPIRNQPHIRGEIVVEDDVWIGSNAVITSNVTLAMGTVVGAGAVVTRSTEPYSIVAGVPARKIGERA